MITKVKDVNFIVEQKDLEWENDESLVPNTPTVESNDNEVLLGDNDFAEDDIDDMEEYYNE